MVVVGRAVVVVRRDVVRVREGALGYLLLLDGGQVVREQDGLLVLAAVSGARRRARAAHDGLQPVEGAHVRVAVRGQVLAGRAAQPHRDAEAAPRVQRAEARAAFG